MEWLVRSYFWGPRIYTSKVESWPKKSLQYCFWICSVVFFEPCLSFWTFIYVLHNFSSRIISGSHIRESKKRQGPIVFVILKEWLYHFYAKSGAWEGTEQLLTSNCCIYLCYKQFLWTPCFIHRVDAKAPVFRNGTLVPYFLYTIVQKYSAHPTSLLSRDSESMAKLADAGAKP